MKRLKVPRASIAVTTLDDPDYIVLMQTAEGRSAFAIFCALLCAAKVQDNGGKFEVPLAVLAALIRVKPEDLNAALIVLRDTGGIKPWILCDSDLVVIRNFAKWNKGWGGPRDNSGRKNDKKKSSGNQVETKMQPSGLSSGNQVETKMQPSGLSSGNQVVPLGGVAATATVPASVTVVPTELPQQQPPSAVNVPTKSPKRYADDFEQWWQAYPRKCGKWKAYEVWRRMAEQDKCAASKAVTDFAGAWSGAPPDRRQFIPHPATWLAQGRWDDDRTEWTRQAQGASGAGQARPNNRQISGESPDKFAGIR